METGSIIVFTCNWDAYSGLETAGAKRHSYQPEIIPIKLMCLGRISTGIILKVFERGADGVFLIGCPKDECKYYFGNKHAKTIVAEAQELLTLLGYSSGRLKMDSIAAGEGDKFTEKVRDFAEGLSKISEGV